MQRDLYAEVSARILAELERGAAPWVKPWSATPGQNVPQNAVTNRPYFGCNVILLWPLRLGNATVPNIQAGNRGRRACAEGRARNESLLREAVTD